MAEEYKDGANELVNNEKKELINQVVNTVRISWGSVLSNVYTSIDDILDGLNIPYVFMAKTEPEKKSRAEEINKYIQDIGQTPINEYKRYIKNKNKDKYSEELHSVFKKVGLDDEHQTVKGLAGVLDLAGYFNCFDSNHSTIYENLYNRLSEEYPTFRNISLKEWEQKCKDAKKVRNELAGHISETGISTISEIGLKDKLNCLIDTIKPFPKTTEKYLKNIERTMQRSLKKMTSSPTEIAELDIAGITTERIIEILDDTDEYPSNDYYVLGSKEEVEGYIVYCLNTKKYTISKQAVTEALKYEDNKNSSNNTVLQLKELATYTNGFLSDGQIRELLETHVIILDESIILDKNGRDFIDRELIPLIKTIRNTDNRKFLIMEATTRYNIYKKVEEYKELEKEYNGIDWFSPNADQNLKQSMKEKISALKAYNIAFNYMEDYLHKLYGVLMYIGTPAIYMSSNEALVDFFDSNSDIRSCVLTCGVSELVNEIDKKSYPLVCISRVSRNRLAKEGDASYQVQIFKKYLPLSDICVSTYLEDDNSKKDYFKVAISDTDNTKLNSVEKENPIYTNCETKNNKEEKHDKKNDKETLSGFKHSSICVIDKKKLEVSTIVESGCSLKDSNGNNVMLMNILQEDGQNAEGGEGVLYETNIPGQVAKIYHTKKDNYKLTLDRKIKLERMVAFCPRTKNVCWPNSLLYNERDEFVGYLMPLAPQEALSFLKSVMQIAKPTIQKEILKSWNRYDLVKVAIATAKIIEQLHKDGILMGDVNPGNLLVNPNDSSEVYAVDCDSYQFDGFACPVGTVDFTHPGTYERIGAKENLEFGSFLRTEEEEDFVLAMLIFQILFLNEYPFTVKGMSPAEAMKKRIFPYNPDEAADVPDGDNWMIWKNLPKPICVAFTSVFKDWKHVTASEWVKLLEQYKYLIEKKGYSSDIAPKKYHEFNLENPFYMDVICSVCGSDSYNTPIKKYKELREKNQDYICPSCMALRNQWEKNIEYGTCDECGKQAEFSLWDLYLQNKGLRKLVCKECRNPQVRCDACFELYSIPAYQKKELLKKNGIFLCDKCRKLEKLIVHCDSCGKTTEIPKKAFWAKKTSKQPILCSTCFRKYR